MMLLNVVGTTLTINVIVLCPFYSKSLYIIIRFVIPAVFINKLDITDFHIT